MYYIIFLLILIIVIMALLSSTKEGMVAMNSSFINKGPVPYAKNLKINHISFDKNMSFSFKLKLEQSNIKHLQEIFTITNSNKETLFSVLQCPSSDKLQIMINTDKNSKEFLTNCEISSEINTTNHFSIIRKNKRYLIYKNHSLVKNIKLGSSSKTESGDGELYTNFNHSLVKGDVSDLIILSSNKKINQSIINDYFKTRLFNSVLVVNDRLNIGERLESNDRGHYFIYNFDGTLSVNKSNRSNDLDKYIDSEKMVKDVEASTSIWKSHKDPQISSIMFKFLLNGNIVLKSNKGILWSTNTSSMNAKHFALNNDGKIYVYDKEGNSIWNN